MANNIKEHELRLTRLRAWANSPKPASNKSDSVYIASATSVLALGMIWTLSTHYFNKDKDKETTGTEEINQEYVVKTKKVHKGYELESDDEESI